MLVLPEPPLSPPKATVRITAEKTRSVRVFEENILFCFEILFLFCIRNKKLEAMKLLSLMSLNLNCV